MSEMATDPDPTTLRPAETTDAPRLTEVARGAYGVYVARIGRPPRPMEEDYGETIRRHAVTVAERGGEVAGFVVLVADGEEGFLVDNVAVDPDRQGGGVGRALLEHAEAEARRAGHDSLYHFTHELMTENQSLYARIGYAEYARRVDGDAVLVFMRKRLVTDSGDS